MGVALALTRDFAETECAACAMVFWVPEHWLKARRRSHEGFYCPNGHSLVFKGESDEEKLRRELAAEQRRLQQALQRENEERTAKVKLQRKIARDEKRLKNGVCPCCNRTFVHLQRHMKTKHPEYGGV
jgi:hypothetical protein